jgi:hypothetical protein
MAFTSRVHVEFIVPQVRIRESHWPSFGHFDLCSYISHTIITWKPLYCAVHLRMCITGNQKDCSVRYKKWCPFMSDDRPKCYPEKTLLTKAALGTIFMSPSRKAVMAAIFFISFRWDMWDDMSPLAVPWSQVLCESGPRCQQILQGHFVVIMYIVIITSLFSENQSEICVDSTFRLDPFSGKLDAYLTYISDSKTLIKVYFTAK